MLFAPDVPPLYRAVLAPPACAITNSMACRVFRGVRLGIINDQHVISLLQLGDISNPNTSRRVSVEVYSVQLDTSSK